MGLQTREYDPRYLAGMLLFNAGDFFDAHEVWEDLWAECTGADRRFVQGLIQAAVGLCHFGNGNVRGAVKLYHSARAYMEGLGTHWGLDVPAFWRAMAACFAEALATGAERRVALRAELLPDMGLDPPPAAWPDPAAFAGAEDD